MKTIKLTPRNKAHKVLCTTKESKGIPIRITVDSEIDEVFNQPIN